MMKSTVIMDEFCPFLLCSTDDMLMCVYILSCSLVVFIDLCTQVLLHRILFFGKKKIVKRKRDIAFPTLSERECEFNNEKWC